MKEIIGNTAADGSGSFVKNDSDQFVFFHIGDDFRIEFISAENLLKVSEHLGWEIPIGTYLPDRLTDGEKLFFIEQLKNGFTGRCFSFRIPLSPPKDDIKEFEIRVTPSQVIGGKITQLVLTIPIPDNKEAVKQEFLKGEEKRFEKLITIELELKASELKYKYVFENNPAPMYVWDRDTTQILAVNERFEQLYGYTKAELLSMTVLDIQPKEDYDRLLSMIKDDTKFFNLGERELATVCLSTSKNQGN